MPELVMLSQLAQLFEEAETAWRTLSPSEQAEWSQLVEHLFPDSRAKLVHLLAGYAEKQSTRS